MTVVAGFFLAAFGAAGAWFLAKRFPNARFLRAGYALMSAGGVLFVIWALSRTSDVGIAAVVATAAGATTGIVGALRRELRSTL